MRVAIREQLAVLVGFAVLVALAIVSIPTWIFVNSFVVDVESDGLALTASLKAARISSEIELIQASCQSIASRLLLQEGLADFYNQTRADPFEAAQRDIQFALMSGGLSGLLQAKIYSRNTMGDPNGLLNVTGLGIGNQSANIELPYLDPDGSRVNLSDTPFGYPPMLYPNITYQDLGFPNPYLPSTPAFAANAFSDVRLSNNGGLLLGPLAVNESYALVSITVPVSSNTVRGFILGYLTLVASAETLVEIQTSREGLGQTGMVLMIGSTNPFNRFNSSLSVSNGSYSPPLTAFENSDVHFILPPNPVAGQPDRHASHSFDSGDYDNEFALKRYPSALDVFYANNSRVNNATSTLSTTNEQGHRVAVGVARPQTSLVSWAIIVEQDGAEAYAPILKLRQILLGCVFGTAGLILIIIVPCAHLSVLPIRRLKSATEKSIAPPGYEAEYILDEGEHDNLGSGGTGSQQSRRGLIGRIRWRIRRRRARQRAEAVADSHRRVFKIPGRVEDRRHFITDELTELTQTFNEMTDELLKQYTLLDKKVAERTRELEISKKAAESANESKTLFIANISHELKTPLNGIMGMCTVCMEEDDVGRIKQSLKTLYRSGDLLLHLLEDLLSFSKNQIGHQVNLEEKEFRLGDIRSQMLAIFDKQARENKIHFGVRFVAENGDMSRTQSQNQGQNNHQNQSQGQSLNQSPERSEIKLPALGPPGVGRLKDMCLWGDQHRVLQVIINLVSNSLKFTPAGGRVELRVRCLGELEQPDENNNNNNTSRTSSFSKNGGSSRPGRSRNRVGSTSVHSASSKGPVAGPSSSSSAVPAAPPGGTALSINPLDPRAAPHVQVWERSPTPPPLNAKPCLFEFEVEDTGLGIPEHMQAKIFEPFVQGDLGLSKKFGGTGLGLSICSQLARLMGGAIEVKSDVGKGTTFTMRIPFKYVRNRASSTASSTIRSRPPSVVSVDADGKTAENSVLDKRPRLVGLSQPFFATDLNRPARKEEQMAAIDRAMVSKAAAAGQGRRLRVLVADDNATNIEVVSRMLKLEEVYDVTIAQDGQEAYDLVKADMQDNRGFDVIFMDIQMPNLDGLQTTRLIRKLGYQAPIVALTAFSEESNVRECLESGMNEFLSKPIRRPALKQVLQKFATIPEEPETSPTNKPEGPKSPGNQPEGPKSLGSKPEAPKSPTGNKPETPKSPHSNGSPRPITADH